MSTEEIDRAGFQDLAGRIKWVNGNFLDSLPFSDDEFDHVYMRFVGRGVPEAKWHHLIMEAYRVLRVGGVLEIVEEDIIFPSLPKSYTVSPLNKSDEQNEDDIEVIVRKAQQESVHDYDFLEKLFLEAMKKRNINLTPTLYLPAVVDIFFNGVTTLPPLRFPLPPPPINETTNSIGAPSVASRSNGRKHRRPFSSSSLTLNADHMLLSPKVDTCLQPYFSTEHTPIANHSQNSIRRPVLVLCERALSPHLLRSLDPCREAMWDIASRRITEEDHSLLNVQLTERVESRDAHEGLKRAMARYEEDVTSRASLEELVKIGLDWLTWKPPLSTEQGREREEIRSLRDEARRLERAGLDVVEVSEASRVIRPIIGWKHQKRH